MEQLLFFVSVFLAGALSFFSPCILPLIPVYVGILLDTDDERRIRIFRWHLAWYGLAKTFSFIAGLSVIFLILGYGAGSLGQVLNSPWFRYITGGMVILLGIHQMEWITISSLQKEKKLHVQVQKKRNDVLQAFLIGLTFSFGWTPCVGPILASVLGIAASGGSGASQGLLLMLLYTIGLSLPFLAMSLASGFVLEKFQQIKPHLPFLKKLGGAIIVVMGILLILGNLNLLATLFE